MAKKTGKKDNKEIIKIAAVVILFGAIGFLIFNNYINKPDPELSEFSSRRAQLPAVPSQQASEIEDLENMQLYLDSLVKHGDWPVEFDYESAGGSYGRSNPFLPLE